jgi:large subunit ribosomal protein L21
MYAVIKTGGKQQKVTPGDVIEVERLAAAEDGSVTFQPILVVDDDGKAHVGKALERATVTAKLVGETRGEKIRGFTYKPKSGYARRQGHRQTLAIVEIVDVKLGTARKRTTKKAEEPSEEPADAAARAE